MKGTRSGRLVLAGAVGLVLASPAMAGQADVPSVTAHLEPLLADVLRGDWARIAGRDCWAELVEIDVNSITFQPPGSAPLQKRSFTAAASPADPKQVVLTLADGHHLSLRINDASHFSDQSGCRYQRDD